MGNVKTFNTCVRIDDNGDDACVVDLFVDGEKRLSCQCRTDIHPDLLADMIACGFMGVIRMMRDSRGPHTWEWTRDDDKDAGDDKAARDDKANALYDYSFLLEPFSHDVVDIGGANCGVFCNAAVWMIGVLHPPGQGTAYPVDTLKSAIMSCFGDLLDLYVGEFRLERFGGNHVTRSRFLKQAVRDLLEKALALFVDIHSKAGDGTDVLAEWMHEVKKL